MANETTPMTFIREPLRFSRGYAVTGRIHLIHSGRALCGADGRKGEEWQTSDELVERLLRTVNDEYGACKRCAAKWNGA